MNPRLALPILLLAGVLAGCNDGDTSSEAVAQQKTGYGESELYDPIHHPEGALLPEGATAVISLESVNGPAHHGDTGDVGYDELWFEWTESTALAMFMEDEDLGVIARVELWDAHGGLHLEVDAERRYGEVHLPADIYGLRLYAVHDEPTPMMAFIRYELGEPSANGQQFGIQTDESEVEMEMTWNGCPKCDLSGAEFIHTHFNPEFNLAGANLSHAHLYGVALYGADLSGADLSWARLTEVNLTGANLTGANLWGATLIRTFLTGADLSGAIGPFGWVCAPGSIGECKYPMNGS